MKSLIRAVLLIGLTLPPVTQAAPPGPGMGDTPSRRGPDHCEPGFPPPFAAATLPGDAPLPPFLHGLKLSDEQLDRIFAIRHEQIPRLRDAAKAARKALTELRDLAFAGKYADATAKPLADAGAQAMAETALLHARADQQMIALLTPEQRKQMADMKARLDAHFNKDFMPR